MRIWIASLLFYFTIYLFCKIFRSFVINFFKSKKSSKTNQKLGLLILEVIKD